MGRTSATRKKVQQKVTLIGIRAKRKKAGLSAPEVAKRLGLKDAQSVWDWEAGRHSVPHKHREKLFKMLGSKYR